MDHHPDEAWGSGTWSGQGLVRRVNGITVPEEVAKSILQYFER